MAGKSIDEKIADAKAEVERLEREKLTGDTYLEYPKMIKDPKDPSRSYKVANADEEAKVKSGKGGGESVNTFDKTQEEQDALTRARSDADAEAAHAKSRLAGPENGPVAKADANSKSRDRALKAATPANRKAAAKAKAKTDAKAATAADKKARADAAKAQKAAGKVR